MARPAPFVVALAGAVALGWALFGCTENTDPAEPTAPPDAGTGGEPPVDAGPACAPGTMEQDDGSCLGAGVPPEACAEGFAPDGAEGCTPIFPDSPCPTPGQVAYLGEQSCHDIAPCGSGDWGEIPVGPDTQYVDDSYTAPDADGTAAKPWPTVQQGVDAAASGAIVAVAEGHYVEELVITAPVQLWGRCPTLVTLEGTAAPTISIDGPGASATTVRGLGVTSADHGISVRGATQMLLTHLWFHDVTRHAIRAGKHESPTELTIREIFVDDHRSSSLLLFGVVATLERLVTRGSSDNSDGRGIEVQDDMDYLRRSQVTLRSGVLENHGWANAYIIGSDVTIEASLIRDTAGPEQFGSTYGFGVLTHDRNETGELPNVTIRGSVIDGAHRIGAYFGGGTATVDNTVITDPRPTADLEYGRGIVVDNSYYSPYGPGQVALRGVLIDGASDSGILVWDSELTAERIIVRDTKPRALDQEFGEGIYAYSEAFGPQKTRATITGSIIQGNHRAGVMAQGAEVALDGVVLSETKPQASDDTLGDGLVVSHIYPNPGTAELTHSLVQQNERAGISSFGSAVTLSGSRLDCNPIHINGELTLITDFLFSDLGGNWCGCGSDEVLCQVISSTLIVPSPVDDSGGI